MRKTVTEYYCDNCDTRYEQADDLVTERYTFGGATREVDLCKLNCHKNFIMLMKRGTVVRATADVDRPDDISELESTPTWSKLEHGYKSFSTHPDGNYRCECGRRFSTERGVNMHITVSNRKAASK